jgi:flagellin
MNRLSFAEGVVSVSIENQSGAESVLSDADIAREMTEFMSQSMRLNVASEMIQQSQQSGQHVLSLLSGSLGEAA